VMHCTPAYSMMQSLPGAEMTKITAMKVIMIVVDFLVIHTTGYDTFSGRAAMRAQRIGDG
jgi:hypothetical protein